MKYLSILLLIVLCGCNSSKMNITLPDGKVISAETSSMGRGASTVTVDPTTGVVDIVNCYDATSDWLALRILPATFQGIVAAYRGIAPQALGGGAMAPGPSNISGCDALFEGAGEE
jgi:hypothetical protein